MVEDLYLKAIVDSFSRLQSVKDINTLTENQIRNYLAYDLERNNPLLKPWIQLAVVKLTKENTLLPKPTATLMTDIEFFISFFGDFVVECKRLSSADSRYINEGVHRFVNEIYSTNDSEAGLIGFIVGGNPTGISGGLRTKLTLEDSYKDHKGAAKTECNGYSLSYHTLHGRKTKGDILLHHLFVSLV